MHQPHYHLCPSISLLVGKGDVHLPYIVDPNNRTAWITGKVDLAKSQFMDGINIDIEQAVEEGSPEYHALTDLVKETTDAFHSAIPGSQVKAVFDTVLQSVVLIIRFLSCFSSFFTLKL